MTAAGITISEKTIGVWRVALPGGDWLAHLFRNDAAAPRPPPAGENGPGGAQAHLMMTLPTHIMVYRFRWDRDSKAERPWAICGLRPGTVNEEAIEKVRAAQDNLMTYGLGGWELLRAQRTPAEYFTALREMPGMGSTAGIEVIYRS